MYFFDLGLIIKFWLILFLLGVLFLPLTTRIFFPLFDRGYIFSKVIGIIILSYILFILGIARILPFNFISILLLIIIYAVVLIFINGFKLPKLPERKLRRIWVFEESVFFIALIAWSYVKGFQPDINGLEKFMDFGFINSILRSQFFPPVDMWFTPESINYYYFGHLQTAFLTKLSGIEPYITYNLMIAAIFAFCFVGSFSLVFSLTYDLFKKVRPGIFAGILSSLLVTLGGNLHTIYAFFEKYVGEKPVPFWELKLLPLEKFGLDYWYPNATRFIFNTIHEFPSYSFVVSDLHGHVLDIPIVLLTLTVSFVLIKKKSLRFIDVILFSFLTAIMYMTNAWDGIIYSGLIIIIIIYKNLYILEKIRIKKIFTKESLSIIKPFIFQTLLKILILGIGFFIFTLPFNIYFKPFASGIGVLCAPDFLTQLEVGKTTSGEVIKGRLGPLLFEENHCQKSPLYQLAILWGFFYITFLIFIGFLFTKGRNIINKKPVIFSLILVFFSSLLILTPEFIYAKDIYPAHYRANTMFKLGYQAYIMLSLISGFSIIILIRSWKRLILIPLFTILVGLILVYPYFSIRSYFGELTHDRYQGLNGIAYLEFRYPDDYKAITWINENIKGQGVIAEAQGDSYTDYGRISVNTGLPTILGWTVHEWLWRGDYSIPEPRINDVKSLYEGDVETVKSIINKYSVEFIFVGKLEREKYPYLKEDNFKQLGDVIYESNDARIYQVN